MARQEKSRLGKFLIRGLLILTVLIVAFGALNYRLIMGIYHGMTLFEPDKLVVNFRSADQRFRSSLVAASADPSEFSYNLQDLPESYSYAGQTKSIAQFIEDTDTTGLIVTSGDVLLYEDYWHGNTEASRVVVWSASKSVVSALTGIAIKEGFIRDVSDPVTDYVPSLAVSGYNGVPIKDILQMSSGISFNEDYFDASSDFNQMAPRSVGLGGPLEDVLLKLEAKYAPGTVRQYASSDSQVLGMVIREATGVDLATYTETKLWQPAGMEFDAYWYLHDGSWNGRQIVPSSWVEESVQADAPHLLPTEDSLGYGYQWWVPSGEEGDFLAIGIYGQAIYVNPHYNIVIAKSSAYRRYDQDGEEMELESVAFMRAIAKALGEDI